VQRAKDELRDFAHRADRRRIGLARHATGDKRQPEGQSHRDNRFPDRHAEARVPEPGKRNQRHDLADGKPAHGRLDAFGFARSRRAKGEHLSEVMECA